MDNPKKQQLEGSWKQFKGRLQEMWGDITNDELDEYEGRREQLEGHIQRKTGEKRETVRKKLDRAAKDVQYSI